MRTHFKNQRRTRGPVLLGLGLLLVVGVCLSLNQPAPVARAETRPERVLPQVTAEAEIAALTPRVYLPLIGRNMCVQPASEVEPNQNMSSAQKICVNKPPLPGSFVDAPDMYRVFVDQAGTLGIMLYVDPAAGHSSSLALYGPSGNYLTSTTTPYASNMYYLSWSVTQTNVEYYIWVSASVAANYALSVSFP